MVCGRAARAGVVATVLGLVSLLPGSCQDPCATGGQGCIDAIGEEDTKCMKWRQTGACNPDGPREKHGDKPCNAEIPTGSSGYCQCGKASLSRKARKVTCDHRPFTCHAECLQLRRYMCVGWKQTGGCDADGKREPDLDRRCDQQIDSTMSGYCECGEGRIIRKPGCKHGEFAEPFTCLAECAAEADLYEELGVDRGASAQEAKQAFRKLSLKYHPDKTRNNAALTARFNSIREAYEIISNQEQRALYDAAGLKMVFEARGQRVEKGPAMNGEVQVTLESMYNGEDMTTMVQRKVICRGCKEKHSARCQKCTQRCADEFEVRNVRMGPMVMQQQVQVPSKEKCRVDKAKLEVHVEPGMSAGDTIVFKSMGEQQPNKIPGDIVLTLKDSKHKTFRRLGVDLHTQIEITLREALLGWERTITQLDGRTITFGYDGVTAPFAVVRISDEGMPHRGDPTQRGSMIITCKIIMPQDGRKFLAENAPSSRTEL